MAEDNSKRHAQGRKSRARVDRGLRATRRKARRRTLYFIVGGSIAALLILSLLLPQLPFGGGAPGTNPVTVTNTPFPIDGTAVDGGTPEEVGTLFLGQGQTHIPFGSPHPRYNSVPPTSGWHYDTPAPWGVYDSQLANETFIHNMEHGGIVISYNLADEAQIAELKELVQGQPGYPGCFIVQPYGAIDEGTVALTAWLWLQRFDGVDTEGMQRFINAHKNRGTEQLGPGCGGSSQSAR